MQFEGREFWHEVSAADFPSKADYEQRLANAIFSTAEEIEQDQVAMRTRWRDYARMYSNRNELGLYWGDSSQSDSYEALVTENVVKSVIDTAASIIAKSRVRCRILTNGAVWSDQRKARKLEKYLYSEMHARKLWDMGPEVFRDSCVFGTGALKVIPDADKKRVSLERVLIDEIIVDESQAIRGNPREMFQRRLVDRDMLIARYPSKAEEIETSSKRRSWAERSIPNDQVMVIEAYRKGPKGRKVIAVEHVVLSDAKFTDEDFPFVFFRWDGKPISGFYGLGLARDLQGYQVRINQLNNFIQKCQDLIAVPRIFVDVASKILKIEINNKIGAIIPYRGKPPTFFTPQALNSEIYQYKDAVKRSAFEFAGISQLSAQSQKPAGLESAVALREFTDIEGQRFSIQAQRYERFFTDIGAQMLRAAKQVYKNADNVRFTERTVVNEIPWKDVDLERERFDLDIQPASLLSMSPAARLQAVTELAQVGQLSPPEIRYLLQHPDLESSNNLANAEYEDIIRTKELLFDGDYEPPEPFQNIELGMRTIQLGYLEAKLGGAPEDILENIRTWLTQANDLKLAAAPPPQEAAPPMGAEELPPELAGGAPPMGAAEPGMPAGGMPPM